MKVYLMRIIIFFSCLLLGGCASHRALLTPDRTQETWLQRIDTNPSNWISGASTWFLTGNPNASLLSTNGFITQNVEVPAFERIKVVGDFQVQIFGTSGPNTVTLYGPKNELSTVLIKSKENLLYLHQGKTKGLDMQQVIVRIGVNQLNSLSLFGQATVEGIHLRSNDLTVASYGSGNIYLQGNMRLKALRNAGKGKVTVIGAYTPELEIQTTGRGSTNISGKIRVKTIRHTGKNDINLIGVNANELKIDAHGRGKIGINGRIRLCEVQAHNYVRVYINGINSVNFYACAFDKARIGLAGRVKRAYLKAVDVSVIAAKNLCANAAYVRARNWAHINATASRNAFASATENASVYFFGQKQALTPFVDENGVVLPIEERCSACCLRVPIVKRVVPHLNLKGER